MPLERERLAFWIVLIIDGDVRGRVDDLPNRRGQRRDQRKRVGSILSQPRIDVCPSAVTGTSV